MIVGLDMGGTHIDAVIINNGRIENIVKKPTDAGHLFDSIWSSIKELLLGYDKTKIKRINLSTTVSTNAIIENKVTPVGMIIQTGPGISPDYLACGAENVFISGYIDHRGEIIKDLDFKEIGNAVRLFNSKGIKAGAVVTKFSTRNPNNELRIKEMLVKDHIHPVTMGHNLSGKLNFPRRVFTSYLNSAIYYTFRNFADNVKNSMEQEGINAPLFMLKADGGTMSLAAAKEKPVETILSGPAASLMGLNAMLKTKKDALLLDIGGTTTDIFLLADGEPLFEPLGIKIGNYKTLVRAIYSISIGLGGDSSVKVEHGKLRIGPDRAGIPCGFGGVSPTPTDAMIVLGLLDIGNKERATKGIESIGQQLNLSVKDTAQKLLNNMGDIIYNKVAEILLEINNYPVYTVKELLYNKQIKPEAINIIGGPAKALKPILEKRFNLPCYYPNNYHAANAIGAALAKPTMEITMLADTAKGILSVPELGIYENINKNFTLENAKKKILNLLNENVLTSDGRKEEIQSEVTEGSTFNMVRGFYTSGKNIRVKAQVKPGYISFKPPLNRHY